MERHSSRLHAVDTSLQAEQPSTVCPSKNDAVAGLGVTPAPGGPCQLLNR